MDCWEVNRSGAPYGGVLGVRACCSEISDPASLASAAALQYANDLGRIRDTVPDTSFTTSVRVELTPENDVHPLPAVDAVVEDLQGDVGTSSPKLEHFASTPPSPRSYRWRVTAEVLSAPPLQPLEDILGGIFSTPRSVGEVRVTVSRSRGLLAKLDQAIADASLRSARREREMKQASARAAETVRKVRSPLWWFLWSITLSTPVAVRRVRSVLEAYVASHESHSQTATELTALRAARERVAARHEEFVNTWIASPVAALRSFAGRAGTLDLCVAPLENVYPDLLSATTRVQLGASSPELQALLLRSIGHVSLEMAAEVIQAEPSPAGIVMRLMGDPWLWVTPPWGGTATTRSAQYRFIVMPALPASDLRALQDAAEQLGFPGQIVMADQIDAGLAIVALDFFPVSSRDEAQPHIYRPATSPNGKPMELSAAPEGAR
jgi:hypothetical protein